MPDVPKVHAARYLEAIQAETDRIPPLTPAQIDWARQIVRRSGPLR